MNLLTFSLQRHREAKVWSKISAVIEYNMKLSSHSPVPVWNNRSVKIIIILVFKSAGFSRAVDLFVYDLC